jgi:hypothetical protein
MFLPGYSTSPQQWISLDHFRTVATEQTLPFWSSRTRCGDITFVDAGDAINRGRE